MTRTELLTALEAATEGSRSLDREIAQAAGKEIHPVLVARYSTSLDAAISLIPNHYYWMIVKGRTRPNEPLYSAIFNGEDIIGESNATPALAVCAAWLKVLEDGETKHG